MARKQKRGKGETAQSYLPIRDIRNGIVETTDGRYLKILEIEPINFALRSDEEQYNIISSFASWLKISPMRLQCKAITRRADSDKHVALVKQELSQEENPQCRAMGEDYLRLIQQVGSREALTRRFFLIFQYEAAGRDDGDYARIVGSLQAAEQTARAYFLQCGNSIVQPSNSDEATAEILYQIFNRRSCQTEPFQTRVDRVVLDTMLSQGLTVGLDPVPEIPVTEFLAPRGIDLTHRNYILMDGRYYTVLYIRGNGYPSRVRAGWMSALINAGEGIDIDIHLRREIRSKAIDRVAQRIRLNRTKLKGMQDTSTDYEELHNSIQAGYFIKNGIANYNEDLFFLSVFVTVSAQTYEELLWRKRQMTDMLKSMDMQVSECSFQQEAAFRSVLPLLQMDPGLEKKSRRNVLTSGAASAYPFCSFEMSDDNGVLLGVNRGNNSLCIVDFFNTKVHKNANLVLLGTSGAGKTFTMQLLALRMRMRGIQSFIVAPIKGHEFRRACVHIGGEFIKIAPGSPHCINIMEIRQVTSPEMELIDEIAYGEMDSLLARKIQQLMTFFGLLIPNMTNEEEQMLDEALIKTYQDFGITHDNDSVYGTYEVRESATNESMLLTWQGETITVRQQNHSVSVTAVDEVERGGLSVEKQDSVTGSTPQGDAVFSGITFEVINNSQNPVIVNSEKYNPGEVVLTLTTDESGRAATADDALPYGEYILHESATNESMLLTAPDQTVLVEDDGVIYEFTMADEVMRGGVLIEKRDLESKLLTPLGGASLDGTLFEITNMSRNPVYVGGALYQPGEVCATIEVKDGIAQTENRALPYGTYEMQEVKPGEGYLHTDKAVRHFTIRQDGQVVEYRDGDAAYNQVIRGDLMFIKVGEGGGAHMGRFANVAFKLTSQTTGESHIVVTDENGEVRTTTEWNPHSQNTNGNDGVEDEGVWDDHAGTWFGLTTEGWMVETQDGLCALPYDTYTLEELPCEGNQGYELVSIPNITISRNNTTIELGTIDDQFEGVPEIGTTATVDGEHMAEPAGEVTITDTVTYKNLKVGQGYKLSGVLMDKSTGEPLLINEQQITAELEFTPTSSEGTVELTYTFDASALAGRVVVVFEDLYQDESLVASHADLEDEGQTISFGQPEIGTTATVDGAKTVQPAEQITITDTVEYSGLTVGQEYTLRGELVFQATGEPVMSGEEPVTAEATFVAPGSEGTIDIPFTFDATGLEGQAVVVFETLFQGETIIAEHRDLDDVGQTITFTELPRIGTTATVDGSHTADPTGEITIVDVVEYSGLIPGETYTVLGILMDKGSGKPLLVDGAEVTAELEFTAVESTGTVELTYILDASLFAGTSIVVFETLYQDGVEIVAHADINDESQTVVVNPRGGLLIKKSSEDGALEGFTFLVEGENYSQTFVTDGAGEIYIEDLAPGEYTITEQESEMTSRYEIPAGQTVEVTADQAATVEFYNALLRGKITGHKTGAEQAPLEGVTFGLFAAEATDFSAENAIATTETDENGEFFFEAPYDGYQIKELKTAPGYVTMKESIAVELGKTDVDLEDITNAQTVVNFSKVDAESGEELPGAVLELYAPDGSLLDTWETSDIPHVITGLPVGEGYILKEVSAPEGYQLAEDITFAVEETSEIQFVGMVDEPSPEEPEEPETPDEPTEPDEPAPQVPQTGGSRAALWVGALLILALGGLGIVLILLKKSR